LGDEVCGDEKDNDAADSKAQRRGREKRERVEWSQSEQKQWGLSQNNSILAVTFFLFFKYAA
jgi:hypothetical protein